MEKSPCKLILSFGVWFDSKAVGDFRLGQERVIIGCSNCWDLSFERYLQSMWCVLTNRLWDSYMCSQYSM